jgi:predicted  nucleic acid-binding Zn-ribbon protein
MKLDQLKKGLWGFQKASVYAYITMAEEEFSAKLAEKDSRLEASEEQYRGRVEALEQELRTVKEALEQQRSEKMEIASTLLAATQYAETLRREAEETARKEREAWERQLAAAQRELEQYRRQVSGVRELLATLLRGMDDQTQDLEQKMEAVQATCPSHNMSLFERKRESQA